MNIGINNHKSDARTEIPGGEKQTGFRNGAIGPTVLRSGRGGGLWVENEREHQAKLFE